jgi:hypothetical protein
VRNLLPFLLRALKLVNRMRELLLVSVTMVGIGSRMGAAFAQPVGAPTQGQQAWSMASPPASANTTTIFRAGYPNCEESSSWLAYMSLMLRLRSCNGC